ncbi:MAG: ABC transporter ATP-binding protein [Planctomycetota bacterium]
MSEHTTPQTEAHAGQHVDLSPAQSGAAVSIRSLSHAYNRPKPRPGKHTAPTPAYQLDPALNDISLDIHPGEVFGLLGPNASGKSTLLRILATVQAQRPPSGTTPGTAHIFGLDVATQPALVRQQLGVVFQHAGLDDKLSARENLRFHGMLYGLNGRDLNTRCGHWLQSLGLADRAGDLIGSFSGGMRRRVEIAKALLPGPRLLMMDEASTGLDAAVLREIWDLLRERVDQDGLTIALTTHLMHEAEQCDRLAVLSKGRIIAIDSPAGLVGRVGGQVLEVQLAGDRFENTPTEQQAVEDVIARLAPQPAPAIQWIGGCGRVEHNDVAQWVGPVLSELGEQARSVRVGRPTLEDAYLKLTGHRLGGEAQDH